MGGGIDAQKGFVYQKEVFLFLCLNTKYFESIEYENHEDICIIYQNEKKIYSSQRLFHYY